MRYESMKFAAAVAVFAASGAVCAQESGKPVPVKLDGLAPHVAQEVGQAAQQGPAELRRYINRTRMINDLNYFEIVKEESPTAVVSRGSSEKVALKDTTPR